MNKFTLVGTVTKDVIFGGGDIKRPTQVSLAVENEFKSDKDDFIDVIAWNENAVRACRFGKGSYVEVEGVIVPNSYEKNGQRVYTVNLQVTSIKSPRKVKGAYKKPSDELIAQNKDLIDSYKAIKQQAKESKGTDNDGAKSQTTYQQPTYQNPQPQTQPQQEFNPYPTDFGQSQPNYNGQGTNFENGHDYSEEDALPF